jgi:hypothetical protein
MAFCLFRLALPPTHPSPRWDGGPKRVYVRIGPVHVCVYACLPSVGALLDIFLDTGRLA